MIRKILAASGLFSLILIFPLFLSADFLILGPSDFICAVNDPTQADYSLGFDFLQPSGTDTIRSYYAHVHFPEGVRVREVTLYYFDNSVGGDINLSFTKHRMYDNMNVGSFSYTTSGYADFVRTDVIPGSSISAKLINNQSNRYFFRINFTKSDINLRVYGVRIKYY